MRFILIAAERLEFAKTRLAPVLPPDERRALAEAMFRDVLAAAVGANPGCRPRRRGDIGRGRATRDGTRRPANALAIDEEFPARPRAPAIALARLRR